MTLAGLPLRLRRAGPPTGKLRLLRRQVLADLSDGAEDGLVQLSQDVEATNLVLNRAEDLVNRLRIQLRTVGGDPVDGQPAARQDHLEPPEERPDIPVSRVVVQDLVAQPFEGAVVDDRQDTEGAVVQLVSGEIPGEAVEGPIEVVVSIRATAFFSPGLHPVLDGGEGDEDPMVSPEVPTGGLIGQAVLHDQPNGQRHDPMGIEGLGRGQVGHVGGEIVAALSAVMLGIGELDVAGPAPQRVAEIMQGAGKDPIPGAGLAASRTRPMLVISTARDQLRGREHLGIGNAQSGVWRVDSRTKHGNALLYQGLFSLNFKALAKLCHPQIPGGGAKVSKNRLIRLFLSVISHQKSAILFPDSL